MITLLLNDEKIKGFLEEHKIEGEEFGYYFYGIVTASLGKTAILGTFAALANDYYIVQFTNKKIDLIKLGKVSGKPESYYSIPFTDVNRVTISNWLFGMGKKIYIELKEGQVIKLKTNKTSMGIKKQKENLLKIEKYLEEIKLLG